MTAFSSVIDLSPAIIAGRSRSRPPFHLKKGPILDDRFRPLRVFDARRRQRAASKQFLSVVLARAAGATPESIVNVPITQTSWANTVATTALARFLGVKNVSPSIAMACVAFSVA